MAQYWVVGGEYKTTNFREIVDGGKEERHGPFKEYDDARKQWATLAMETVDHAHIRYRIEKEDSSVYWVVGGVFSDTSFTTIAKDQTEERHGPYDNEEGAMNKWRERAWETVDDAFAQFRVEKI